MWDLQHMRYIIQVFIAMTIIHDINIYWRNYFFTLTVWRIHVLGQVIVPGAYSQEVITSLLTVGQERDRKGTESRYLHELSPSDLLASRRSSKVSRTFHTSTNNWGISI